jgi:hypothetical protein
MKTENTAIRILAITAALLMGALFFLPGRTATAEVALKEEDYLVATYPSNQGDDALYITDTRSGVIAVFIWDRNQKALVPKAMRRLEDGFQVR